MPNYDDSLGGQTMGGEDNEDRFEKSLGDEHTMGGDTDINSLGDASTMGDANIADDWDDGDMELVDLSARYTEEGVLGKGGMGEVLLATDTRLDRKVAIKRILGKAARSKTATKRFLTEAKSIAALNHPNIVQIHDYGRSTEGPFLIMECVLGGSLLDKCKEGVIELEEAVNIFSQLCDGLAKAHATNIIHRDIKPANVLMTEDGVPKLTDFGLAKDDTADTGMTMQGAVIGTLDFMPPEQRQAAELTDHRSDLWSLAATFYQMVTGKSPKVINITAAPKQLQSVLGKALEESKEERYQSALEMKEAVQQSLTAGLDINRDLGQGECPSCGTTNPSDRKFCRDCSSPLQVKCLSCNEPTAIWDKACGECGAQQQPLIQARLEELQSYHDAAEQHLRDLVFDQAAKAAAVIEEQKDSRLQQFAAWHEDFISRLEATHDLEYRRLEESLTEALAHEKAYDYQAGLRVLKQVAPSLLETKIDRISDTASELTARLDKKESRLKSLREKIRTAVNGKQLKDLLAVVRECLALKADQDDLVKLQQDLIDRQKAIDARNQQIISQAKQYMQQLQFDEAVQILNTITPEHQTESTNNLTQLVNHLSEQRQRILSGTPTALANKLYQVAIENISQYLTDIAEAGLQDPQLHQMLVEARNVESTSIRNKNIIRLGIAVAGVVLVLITGMIIKANLDTKALETAIAKGDWQAALERDPTNSKALDLKAAAEQAAAIKDALAKGDWQTALELEPDNRAGLRLKSDAEHAANQAAAIEEALAKGDWRTALRLNPTNSRALALKATAERAVAIKDALAQGDWQTALELDPNNREALDLKAAAEKAASINDALAEGDWRTVLELDPNNNEALALKAADEQAVAIEGALAKGDWRSVLRLDPKNRKALTLRAADVPSTAIKTLSGHDDSVNSVAFSPDGKTIGSASADKTIKIWDSRSQKEITTLTGHLADIKSIAFSPDGKTIASASEDQTIKLWGSQNGWLEPRLVKTLKASKNRGPEFFGRGEGLRIAFSPDGKTIASGSGDGTIKLWDIQTGAEIKTLYSREKDNYDSVYSLAFSPEGKTIITGEKNAIALFDSKSGKVIHSFSTDFLGNVYCAAFSPDGKKIATGWKNKTIKLWDSKSRNEINTLSGHDSVVLSIAFSPDSKIIASAGADSTVKLWYSQSGEEIKTFIGHRDYITSVAFSPDGKTIASASGDKTIKLWDVSALAAPSP